MKKILIVGSKGFIGKNLFQYLSENVQYDCYGCDLVIDEIGSKYFSVCAVDSDFSEIILKGQFDYCINCSGAASVPESIENPLNDFTLNVLNVAKLLDAIRKYASHCKFINLSSAAVYGNPIDLPVREDAQPGPVSPYGKHKQMAEELNKEYYDIFHISTISARIFSAYGPGLRKQLLWDISQKALSQQNVELFGTGNESRDFIFIEDIVKAIEILMLNGNYKGNIYNIANGEEVTVKIIATLLLEEMQFKGKLIFNGKLRTGDPTRWKANIDKLVQLGFQPSITLKTGIKKYVTWLLEEK